MSSSADTGGPAKRHNQIELTSINANPTSRHVGLKIASKVDALLKSGILAKRLCKSRIKSPVLRLVYRMTSLSGKLILEEDCSGNPYERVAPDRVHAQGLDGENGNKIGRMAPERFRFGPASPEHGLGARHAQTLLFTHFKTTSLTSAPGSSTHVDCPEHVTPTGRISRWSGSRGTSWPCSPDQTAVEPRRNRHVWRLRRSNQSRHRRREPRSPLFQDPDSNP